MKVNPKKKIERRLSNRRRPIGQIIEPFFLNETDPKFNTDKTDPRNSRKVLTIKKPKRILKLVIKRKDGKMATKQKTTLTLKQQLSIAGLVFLAVLGAASMLGLGWSGCLGGVAIAGMLGVFAADI